MIVMSIHDLATAYENARVSRSMIILLDECGQFRFWTSLKKNEDLFGAYAQAVIPVQIESSGSKFHNE